MSRHAGVTLSGPLSWQRIVFTTAVLVALSGLMLYPTRDGVTRVLAQTTSPRTFKIAFWNVQSGFGERPLPGRACAFTENANCTDASLPLNAWGIHIVQDELIRRIRNDPAVIAIGLAEAWTCATPAAVQQVLGWRSRSTARSGIALIAKFGFAGPERWIQLDTTGNLNPVDTKFVLRVPVCVDHGCTRAVTIYTAHMYASSATDAAEYAGYATQATQILDFAEMTSGSDPHVIIGDLNVFEGTSLVCTQKPKNDAIEMLRRAGYLDAWPAVRGTLDGSTAMWNRARCGVPEGSLWKRIDYGWSKRMNPLSVSRFGMVEPGQCAPSDHAGILIEYAVEDASVAPPRVVIDTPAQNATVAGRVSLSAQAIDPLGVRRVEWLLDERVIAVMTSAPFVFDWDAQQVPNGAHILHAAATNTAGRRATSAARAITVFNPSGPDDEVVLHAVNATVRGTAWSFVTDATAASGSRLQNANAGIALSTAQANPASYVELAFDANAGLGYRLWIRGRAVGNSFQNDSVFVQFNDAVDAGRAPVFRIGTSASTVVNLEDCVGCGLSNWGWQDNETGRDVLGPLIYFPTSGPHRLRLQAKEDGFGFDQIVLSAVAYRFGGPGRLLNDTTILAPGAPTNRPPTVQLTSPLAGMTVTAPATVWLTATATDPDDGIAGVEFFANGTLIGHDASAPYTASWVVSIAGQYVLTARATDTRGATTTSAGVSIAVRAPIVSVIDEIVIHLARQPQILGGWNVVGDATAAGGARLQNANAAAAKLTAALANPTEAFEVTFNAEAGKGYRIWVRGRAQNDSYMNDSIFLQFNGSVSSAGAPMWRIGTTGATPVIIEDCSGCGLQGWGWGDNTYVLNALGPLVYFAQTGPQRLRVQRREDGIGLDQVVLSAVQYLTVRPGAARQDTTILPTRNTP